MHPEFLQIRRQTLEDILDRTRYIDPKSEQSTQHKDRSHNAYIIAGAITGIIGNIDSDLARDFADALGIGLHPSTRQQVPA
jgi:hypothetical protein